MAAPRVLARPPITEALIDLRASIEQSPETFRAFAQELKPEFPDVDERRGVKTELKIEQGKLIPGAEDMGFQGLRVKNADGTLIAQFRPDGFTLNNLKSYVGGDGLITDALSLWARFAAKVQPVLVTRVALRYINQLELPFRDGDQLKRYLAAPPELPEGAPQRVSEFLTRVVAHDEQSPSVVVVTQRLQPFVEGRHPILQLDVEAFQVGEFPVDKADLRAVLETLRLVKNRTFFSLLTDEAVGLCI